MCLSFTFGTPTVILSYGVPMATYRIDCCNFDLIKDGRNFDKTVILSLLTTTLVFRFQKHCNSPQANINTVNSVGNLFSSYNKLNRYSYLGQNTLIVCFKLEKRKCSARHSLFHFQTKLLDHI